MDLIKLHGRAHSNSGRFLLQRVFRPSSEGRDAVQMIQRHSEPLLRLLTIMESEDAKTTLAMISNEDFARWGGGIVDGLFRIGGNDRDNGVGLANLPRAQAVFRKEWPRATILIPIVVTRTQDFVIYISMDEVTHELDIATAWTHDWDKSDWPQDRLIRRDLLDKVETVLKIVKWLPTEPEQLRTLTLAFAA